MPNAIILHGAGDAPDSYWLPYIKRGLEDSGYEVWAPALPGADKPVLAEQLPFVLERGKFTAETTLIGHSAGCPLILSVLENLPVCVRQAILVSGYSRPLPAGANDILQVSYDWRKISAHVADIIFINSDNDPWGCDDKQARIMFDNLDGTLIIRHGQGHMGSTKFNQPYQEFPWLLKLIV
ncbi:MAG: alpha/beta hydrolase [Candidatus Kerfeldbacteria bacterium]|nr:alpha/beta hydrolase [Candidatus Kerfeldbacteria bacterium]